MVSPVPAYKNSLFCTDFSEHANTAFVHGLDWAKKDNTKLHIFNVMMPDDPCGNSQAKKASDSGESEDSAVNGEDIIQQTIGGDKNFNQYLFWVNYECYFIQRQSG